jgi:hypothetical protein
MGVLNEKRCKNLGAFSTPCFVCPKSCGNRIIFLKTLLE